MSVNDIVPRFMIRKDIEGDNKGRIGDVVLLEAEEKEFWGWTEHQYLEALRQPNTCGQVIEISGTTVGDFVYALNKDNVEILHINVKDCPQRGLVYKTVFEKLKFLLQPSKRHTLCMDVYEGDLTLLNAMKENAFKCTEIKHNFFEMFEHDAFHMEYSIKKAGNSGLDKGDDRELMPV